MKTLLLTTVFALIPTFTLAQSIETGQLGEAQAFDAGVIDARSGGLDTSLWQGTSAQTAVRLMKKLPLSSDKDIVQDMIEAVILSAGVPPQGDRSEYDQTRLKTVMAMGDKAALDNLATRNPDITRDPKVRTDLALAGGDVTAACQIADNITEGRGEPHWAKLRAFCHIEREELSAAELTTELLQGTGYKDDAYYGLMRVLTGASDLAFDQDDLVGSASFDLASAKANVGPQGTAQIFQLANSNDARTSVEAIALMLAAAEKKDVFSRFAKLFENNLAIIPAGMQTETDLKLFTRAAIERGDIGALQGFFQSIPEGPQKPRIALIADALGNGFTLGTLGEDIEARLAGEGAEKRRAIRDTFIAVAMGSRLSGNAEQALEGAGNGSGVSIVMPAS